MYSTQQIHTIMYVDGLRIVYVVILIVVCLQCLKARSDYIPVPNNKIDVGFGHLDKNSDGLVLPEEFRMLIYKDDADDDGCVSRLEYESGAKDAPTALADTMFRYFDVNFTDCLNAQTMEREFTKADKNVDGQITELEWEQYFQNLMKQIFSNHGNIHPTATDGITSS